MDSTWTATASPTVAGGDPFARLARPYRALEFLVFGRGLERVRRHHLGALVEARPARTLLLGDGDGRFLSWLRGAHPAGEVVSVDASAAMVERSSQRRDAAGDDGEGIRWEVADVRRWAFPPAAFDAVTTLFFLDCFTRQELVDLVPKIAAALRPGGLWLHADFKVDRGGALTRARARAWVRILYRAFRATSGIGANRLAETGDLFAAAGLHEQAGATHLGGLAESRLMVVAPCPRVDPLRRSR